VRRALVKHQDTPAGVLTEHDDGHCSFAYLAGYEGGPVSLTMPLRPDPYRFVGFPPFFDGLLPEGIMLDALLRWTKLDRDDRFGQILVVGSDLVGAVTVERLSGAP